MEKTDGAIKDFWSMSLKQVYLSLESNEKGLSEQEVQRRLKTYGNNESESQRFGWRPILHRQFKNPHFTILIACVAISGFSAPIDQANDRARQVRLFTILNSAQ